MEKQTNAKKVIWSATPTPFHGDLTLDFLSVERLVEHHMSSNIEGLLLGGSCGEGPWMPFSDLSELTRIASTTAGDRLQIAVQVTDNSARRMLEHIEQLAKAGAECAVVASPYFLMNANPQRILNLYLEVIRQSPIPVGFYDRGKNAAHPVENDLLPELLAEPNLSIVKDSSMDPVRQRLYLEAARHNPELTVLNGDEFNCVKPLEAGYDGLLLGGGIFNAKLAFKIACAISDGRIEDASRIQIRMNELMFRVYGGTGFACWLTGLKYLVTKMGIFASAASYLEYPLTVECQAAIDEIVLGADLDGYREEVFTETLAQLS